MRPADNSAEPRRRFLRQSGAAVLATAAMPFANQGQGLQLDAADVKVTRLTWAGVKIELDGTNLLIDPILTDIWEGSRPFPIAPLETHEGRTHVLITHTHNDHYDKLALDEALSDRSRVACHRDAANEIAADGYRIRSLDHYQPARLGPFVVMPVPAVDGFGHPAGQVSWIVRAGGRTVIHCGDTLWHGGFWTIGEMYGPFDCAFMPINGAVLPGFKPVSEIPGTMTPEQAVAAGIILGARQIVPIHYGHNDPESYIEYPGALSTFGQTAARRGASTRVLEVGESLIV